ncbi:electron transfer flavoprotein subunit alpha/FixB family protein [Azospirillum agricola]|uniref:electron transfer flavoprotein subunit alpha/FixB family protein n=1 Tax=Azospirillum agricola TaxID=1720247 RepID=UPI000A0F1FBF|nr:FAD-binding protein [Azospirillum agricola]SMH39007.1 electron transfer flavoprotein alpha subunit apoprotein [Azospirillum lipoferum]
MAVLVLAEHSNTALNDATAKAVTAASALGGEVHVLVAGLGAWAAATAAASLAGVARVLLAESEELARSLAEPVADLLVALAPGYDAIVAPATANGKNILPRAAALLDVQVVSSVTKVLGPDRFLRPVYAGNAIQTVRSTDSKKLLTIQPASFAAAGQGGSAPVDSIPVTVSADLSAFLSEAVSSSDRPDLASARIVVSGGRALGSAERFRAVIEPLADKLGAAIGASRAAVDAGYASNDLQVGQTGKIVAPQLYVACGISGAIQHLAGMKDSKVIVAINKDPDAPIFQVADYGLVADLFTAVPEFTAEL